MAILLKQRVDRINYILFQKILKKENQMDEIEKMVYDWVFQNADKVELSQRLQNMPKEKDANERFKKLNNATQEKLNSIGANQKKLDLCNLHR